MYLSAGEGPDLEAHLRIDVKIKTLFKQTECLQHNVTETEPRSSKMSKCFHP